MKKDRIIKTRRGEGVIVTFGHTRKKGALIPKAVKKNPGSVLVEQTGSIPVTLQVRHFGIELIVMMENHPTGHWH